MVPEEKELQTHPLVPFVFRRSCHRSSGGQVLDSAAGAPSGPCYSSEVVSLLLIWRFFPKGKFSCWFKEEE